MKDSIGTIARWTVLGVMFLGTAWLYWNDPAKPDKMLSDFYALLWIASWSAVGYGKLVDNVWLRSSVRRWLGRRKRLGSLDDFARHYYGDDFGALTEAQQIEVGRMERANPMGEWVMQGSGRYLTIQDERMRHEDDRVRAQAQRLMTWTLVCSAGIGSFANVWLHRSMSGNAFVAWGWTLAALGLTLRQAIVTDPSKSFLYLHFADLCFAHNSFQVGIDMLNAGLQKLPESAQLYLARGILFVQLGAYEKAESDFDKAAQLDPSQAFSSVAQGLTQLQRSNLDGALAITRDRLNEELRRMQEELEGSRARYFDLYDLAPVGYFTLSEQGLILEANLTGAKLLGVARGALVKQPLSRFVLR